MRKNHREQKWVNGRKNFLCNSFLILFMFNKYGFSVNWIKFFRFPFTLNAIGEISLIIVVRTGTEHQ